MLNMATVANRRSWHLVSLSPKEAFKSRHNTEWVSSEDWSIDDIEIPKKEENISKNNKIYINLTKEINNQLFSTPRNFAGNFTSLVSDFWSKFIDIKHGWRIIWMIPNAFGEINSAIEASKYMLPIEDGFDSDWEEACPEDVWERTIKFLIEIIGHFPDKSITPALLNPRIAYQGNDRVNITWKNEHCYIILGISADGKSFGYYSKSNTIPLSRVDQPVNERQIECFYHVLATFLLYESSGND